MCPPLGNRWKWGPRPRPSADQSGKDARSGVGAPDTVAEQGKEFATDTSLRSGQIRLRGYARVPFMTLDEYIQPPGDRIETDQIAVADLADRTALHRFGRDVDRCRNLARGTGQPAVGNERDLQAPVLKRAERRHQLMQFWHSVRFRSLEAHHRDHVAGEFAVRKGLLQFILRVEDPGRRLD